VPLLSLEAEKGEAIEESAFVVGVNHASGDTRLPLPRFIRRGAVGAGRGVNADAG
jgi:hypothetical protein